MVDLGVVKPFRYGEQCWSRSVHGFCKQFSFSNGFGFVDGFDFGNVFGFANDSGFAKFLGL